MHTSQAAALTTARSNPVPGRAAHGRPPGAGAPPPLYGTTPRALAHYAVACRASALVLHLEGLAADAAYLADLADQSDTQAPSTPSADGDPKGATP